MIDTHGFRRPSYIVWIIYKQYNFHQKCPWSILLFFNNFQNFNLIFFGGGEYSSLSAKYILNKPIYDQIPEDECWSKLWRSLESVVEFVILICLISAMPLLDWFEKLWSSIDCWWWEVWCRRRIPVLRRSTLVLAR